VPQDPQPQEAQALREEGQGQHHLADSELSGTRPAWW
jgi:hypothetical protein